MCVSICSTDFIPNIFRSNTYLANEVRDTSVILGIKGQLHLSDIRKRESVDKVQLNSSISNFMEIRLAVHAYRTNLTAI
jgi:hypothetical protein